MDHPTRKVSVEHSEENDEYDDDDFEEPDEKDVVEEEAEEKEEGDDEDEDDSDYVESESESESESSESDSDSNEEEDDEDSETSSDDDSSQSSSDERLDVKVMVYGTDEVRGFSDKQRKILQVIRKSFMKIYNDIPQLSFRDVDGDVINIKVCIDIDLPTHVPTSLVI